MTKVVGLMRVNGSYLVSLGTATTHDEVGREVRNVLCNSYVLT